MDGAAVGLTDRSDILRRLLSAPPTSHITRLERTAHVHYRVPMIHANFTEFRKRLAHYMDRANDDRDAILVTRQGAEPVVVLAQSEYDSLIETRYLLSSPANAARLQEAVESLDRGKGMEVVWDEAAATYKPA